MASVNTTVHNYLTKSISFNPDGDITLGHGFDIDIEFAKITPVPSTINDVLVTGTFSVHVWVKFSATASIRSRILQTSDTGENNVGTRLMLGLWGDDTFYGTIKNALRIGFQIGTATQQLTREPVLLPDTWHHIVLTTTPAIYIDGCSVELVDAFPVPDFEENPNAEEGNVGIQPEGLVVGWDPNLDGPLKGNIASLAIFNKVLTNDEIETLAQGTVNLIGTSLNIKSSIVSWWKMGDGDDFTIEGDPILLDSVGTNHLTTVNMDDNTNSVNDVPKERPRKHQNLHLTTGADRLPLDPNGTSCPFIWDSFSNIGVDASPPPGWYSDGAPTFSRVSETGRLSVLKITNTSTNASGIADVITNAHSTQAGNTFTFGPSNNPDSTVYCLETSIRVPSGNNPGVIQIGFFNAYGTYTDEFAGFDNSVFFSWTDLGDENDDTVLLHVTGAAGVVTAFGKVDFLVKDRFYKFKLCFGYYTNAADVTVLRAILEVDDVIAQSAVDTLSSASNYPTGGADIGINVVPNGAAGVEVDIEWISVTHRSGPDTPIV